jgi:hypothetical protein
MINVLLPRHYKPDFRFNLYERRAKSISDQLYNKSLALDYDQILAKKPGKKEGKFVWHQDMASTRHSTCNAVQKWAHCHIIQPNANAIKQV